jgi:hypothetical protein
MSLTNSHSSFADSENCKKLKHLYSNPPSASSEPSGCSMERTARYVQEFNDSQRLCQRQYTTSAEMKEAYTSRMKSYLDDFDAIMAHHGR